MIKNKIYKGEIAKSISKDEDEGQLELYSPKYALKLKGNNYQKKEDEEEGQLKLYSPQYALKVNNLEVIFFSIYNYQVYLISSSFIHIYISFFNSI